MTIHVARSQRPPSVVSDAREGLAHPRIPAREKMNAHGGGRTLRARIGQVSVEDAASDPRSTRRASPRIPESAPRARIEPFLPALRVQVKNVRRRS